MTTSTATQVTVSLSSGEAELYALVKGAGQALGMVSLLADLGYAVDARVHSDSSAAIGITNRKGLGKLRHLNVQFLWVQDKVRDKSFTLHKVPGERNVADLMTKYLDEKTMDKHLDALGFVKLEGRSVVAPNLVVNTVSSIDSAGPCVGQGGALRQGVPSGLQMIVRDLCHGPSPQQQCFGVQGGMSLPADEAHSAETPPVLAGTGGSGKMRHGEQVDKDACVRLHSRLESRKDFVEDLWEKSEDACVRLHSRPRRDLFTPLRVCASPPAKSFFSVRITAGAYCDTGERFRIVDAWTDRRSAHAPLRTFWTGTTTFLRKPIIPM